ncbi:MAG TPA: TIGR00730 family Rossman fold protein [Burkholderiaceae bacterium]|nr:TIGR00730 family Rossman fold protein [Burkholderiaceae bacterium]
MTPRAVCVFCGSQPGRREKYVIAARDTARLLAQSDIELVYGGGHVGLMGALADEALAHGGRVVGVIPEHLMRPEVAHQRLTELIVVDSMHTRKQTMALRSDAFIVLPGGFGTLEEMFEMLTWLQLRLQAKPVGLLNVEGYFDALLQFLEHAASESLIRSEHRDLLLVERTPARLLARLSADIAPAQPFGNVLLG